MPHYIITAAQKAAIDSILGGAISFSTTGVRTGLINGTSYTAMAVDFSPQFTPVAAATLPINTAPPTISGSATQGQTLTGGTGTWTGTMPSTYAFQWRRDGTPINGATTPTYLLGARDVGATLTLAVVATNAAGSSEPAVSAGIGPVVASGGAFNPANLFAGDVGWVYDNGDFTSLFQDLAGTVPVTAPGQPVGYQRDLSGNGLHRTAPSEAARPILGVDENGQHYLESIGSSNMIMATAIHVWGTDEHTVSTGMQRTNPSASAPIYQRSADTTVNDGSFSFIPRSLSGRQTFAAVNRGTTRRFLDMAGTYAEPNKFSLTQSGKLTAPLTLVRINGAEVLNSTSSLGGTVYGAYPMYFFGGSPGNSTTMREYTSVGINRLLTDTERDNLEAWTSARLSVAVTGSAPSESAPSEINFTQSSVDETAGAGTIVGSFS